MNDSKFDDRATQIRRCDLAEINATDVVRGSRTLVAWPERVSSEAFREDACCSIPISLNHSLRNTLTPTSRTSA